MIVIFICFNKMSPFWFIFGKLLKKVICKSCSKTHERIYSFFAAYHVTRQKFVNPLYTIFVTNTLSCHQLKENSQVSVKFVNFIRVVKTWIISVNWNRCTNFYWVRSYVLFIALFFYFNEAKFFSDRIVQVSKSWAKS